MQDLPHVSNICKFTFVEKFSALNGVYRVVKKMTYEQARTENIDFYKFLYNPVGLTKEDYSKDLDNYVNDTVLQLIDLKQQNTIYLYTSLLKSVPDPTVKTYDQVILGINLGYFKNATDYEWIKSEFVEYIKQRLGSDGDAKFFAKQENKVWLTDQEYQQIEDKRKTNIKNAMSVFQKNEELQNEIINLRNIIKTYDDLLTRVKGNV